MDLEEMDVEAPGPVDMNPVGRLHLFSSFRGAEKDFLLYPGENVIGRKPDCTVALPFPSISKLHAIIEIPAQGSSPILRDCGSFNGTRLLKPLRRLSPGVNHHLGDQDLVFFARLPCQYHHLSVPLLLGPQGALEVEEIPSVPMMEGSQMQGTLLAEDSQEERDLLQLFQNYCSAPSLAYFCYSLKSYFLRILSTVHHEKHQHPIGGDGNRDTDVDDNGSLTYKKTSQHSTEEDSGVEGALAAHETCHFPSMNASDLQPVSPEKTEPSGSQSTENPNTEIQKQPMESNMQNQEEMDSSYVSPVGSKVPGSEAPASVCAPQITWSKSFHSSSLASQELPIMGSERGKQTGRGSEGRQGVLWTPNIDSLIPQDSGDKSMSCFQSQTQEPFSSSYVPTAQLVPELYPAISNELPMMSEYHFQTQRRWNWGISRHGGPTQVVQELPECHISIPRERSETLVRPPKYPQNQNVVGGENCESLIVTPESSDSMKPKAPTPQATRSQRVGAVIISGSIGAKEPKFRGYKRASVTKEPSPCPKKCCRGRPQKQAATKEKGDKKSVEVGTEVKTPVEVAEQTVLPKEEVKGALDGACDNLDSVENYSSQMEKESEQAVLALTACLASLVAETSDLVTY